MFARARRLLRSIGTHSATRFAQSFVDPAFAVEKDAIARLETIAWHAYEKGRKAPLTHAAGPGFADPDYELSVEWRATRDRIAAAQVRQRDPAAPSRVLVVIGAARNDGTCPGEISKTFRLATWAGEIFAQASIETDVLDLSPLTSDYGRRIHPCKGCVSTAMPLCHWPCSCYPNHALDQTGDWMAEIYERWAAAHGVMILDAGVLVSGAERAEADDRPAGLRRRRQSRPDVHRRQESGEGQGARARRLGLSASISPAACMASSCTATSPAPKRCGARCPTGSTGWG